MNWDILLSTFGLVFVAELGDKTQLAVVTQVCKHRRSWPVFAGAVLALVAVTAIGAAGGQLLSRFIPAAVLRIAAAMAFGFMGLLIAGEAVRAGRGEAGAALCHSECANGPGSEERLPAGGLDWKVFGSTFGLLFVAELGDKTQLAVLTLASQHTTPWLVFLGGGLALTAVTALGVLGGQGLCRLIPERVLLWISALIFVLMGILMGIGLP